MRITVAFFNTDFICSWWVCQTSTWSRKNQKLIFHFSFTQICIAKTPRVSFSTRCTKHPATPRCEKSGDTQNLWLNLSDGFLGAKKKTSSWLELRNFRQGNLFFYVWRSLIVKKIWPWKSQTKLKTPKKLMFFGIWNLELGEKLSSR